MVTVVASGYQWFMEWLLEIQRFSWKCLRTLYELLKSGGLTISVA